MGDIIQGMDTEQKLNILAESSKYDLACACKFRDEPGRVRGSQGHWIYPAVLPSGRKVFLLKTLQSNVCINDCSYCPFNSRRDIPRCSLSPDLLARTFILLRDAGRVNGLFLSSGVCKNPDATMADMLGTVELLRKRYQFKGYIHLKVLPGASQAAIEQATRLATRVSVNIEAPNAQRLQKLSHRKRFHEDIISAMQSIHRLREQGGKCSQTTQFVVGAAGESDREIVNSTHRLYQKFNLERVYFSAFQDMNAEPTPTSDGWLFPEYAPLDDTDRNHDPFIREHRLYQVDYLFRRYKFNLDDIYFDPTGNLSLEADPKLIWARRHPEFFPIDPNYADYEQLLRVPGIGPVSAKRIITARRQTRIRSLNQLNHLGLRPKKSDEFLILRVS
ncbi:MAG: radical SAM protein [Sedimentisphaerales bacterium]|nr:radical SAM protein [Sedimentisphaerales bacterium]